MPDEARPVCSVCIANYNGIAFLGACLNSVLAQDCGFQVEIIVHDDASTDNSVNLIRDHYPGVKLIASQENVGFCASNNRMAAQAQGEYILLLNNDAELLPDALRTLYAEAAMLEGPAILGLPQYDAASGTLIDMGSFFDPFLNPVPNLDPRRTEVGAIIGACLWIPKTLWQELGGFPEWFHTLAEDTYLCCLARLMGRQVRAIPESGFRHWVGGTLGGGKPTAERRLVTSRTRRALSERNKSYTMVLTYPAPLYQLSFPLHLILLLLEGMALGLAQREWAPFREIYLACFVALWRERHRLLRLRREVQAKRKIGARQFWSVFRAFPHKLGMLVRHGWPEIT
jgi:GT2 family glycosyltransferase